MVEDILRDVCHRSPHWGHFVIGVLEPVADRLMEPLRDRVMEPVADRLMDPA